MLVDGVGSAALADALVPRLSVAGRQVVRVSAGDFLRPAGQRLEHGREDPDAFLDDWLDDRALDREVLSAAVTTGRVLPRLWDAEADRSARARPVDLLPGAVVVVDGVLLLGRGLPAELVVHLALSAGALRRRGVPEWQLPAYARYDAEVRPGEACDVLVRAEDPKRPAVLVRA